MQLLMDWSDGWPLEAEARRETEAQSAVAYAERHGEAYAERQGEAAGSMGWKPSMEMVMMGA